MAIGGMLVWWRRGESRADSRWPFFAISALFFVGERGVQQLGGRLRRRCPLPRAAHSAVGGSRWVAAVDGGSRSSSRWRCSPCDQLDRDGRRSAAVRNDSSAADAISGAVAGPRSFPGGRPDPPPWSAATFTGHTSVNRFTHDEPVVFFRHPPGSLSAEWASFNLGEPFFGAGDARSLIPIAAILAIGCSDSDAARREERG